MPLIRIWPADGPATTGTPATNGTVDTSGTAMEVELGDWKMDAIARWREMYEELAERSRVERKAAYEQGREFELSLKRLDAEIDAEIAEVIATRRLTFSNPPQVAGEGFIYVIKFSTGTVKVGHTLDPKQRFGTHQGDAAVYGVAILKYFISPSHRTFKENETALIDFCREDSRRSRREYYHEVDFETVANFAADLDFPSDITNQVVVEFPTP